jgi:transcriptional regulator GlxA family with amidase domain
MNTSNPHPLRTVGILIFDQVEELDFCGPFEVFAMAGRFAPSFRVITIGEKSPVVAHHGLSVNAQHQLAECPPLDILVVPGGQGTRTEIYNEPLIEWIRKTSRTCELLLSVCTGALLLAKAGLLDGLEATTHHGAIDLLKEVAPKTVVHRDRRFVENERIICSAGISAGIDMSLHVVRKLYGPNLAAQTCKQIEYDWE